MVEICLPPFLRHMVKDLVDVAERCMPREALISRYRVLLDGAFIMCSRILNDHCRIPGGTTRYVMADSSMQHGHEFEVILVNQIPNRDIPRAFRLADTLFALRCLFVFLLFPQFSESLE